MTPTRDTRIHDLISSYPFLLDMLAGYAPEFRKLKNPVARATLGRIATVEMAARMAGKDPDRLLADIASAIARSDGSSAAEAATAGDAATRRETLKAIIRGLHLGEDVVALERRFDGLLREVGPAEIGRIENELIAEGLPVSEVHRLCDLHVKLFRPGLQERPAPSTSPGHPVHTFMTENRVLERACWGVESELTALGAAFDRTALLARRPRVERLLDVLAGIGVHYTRKEQLVFPLLERQGVSGPTQVMWAVDDELRALLKQARAAVQEGDAATFGSAARALARGVPDMIFKEESILFPMCLEMFTDDDWKGIAAVEQEIGLAAVMPAPEPPRKRLHVLGTGLDPQPRPAEHTATAAPQPAGLPLDTGVLSLEQIRLVFSHLPVELSFVDENDEVRFFSGGEKRFFPRSPQVIGRKVQNCHPPKSVATVNRILDSFRSGRRDVAEFWIRFKDHLLHIRYFAVRDAERRYRGTLEVTQDVTGIQALSGERRLLDWDADA